MTEQPPASPDQSDRHEHAGSPSPGEPLFLAVGRLRRTHGIHGEMLMDVLTAFPERLRARKLVYIGEEHSPVRITHVRKMGTADLLVSFAGYEDADQAALLRNKMVFVRAENLPELPEGEYYHHQLLGLRVVDESGKDLGFLTEIMETGANDVYLVVNPEGQETLLPAIESVILGVDLEKREMTVRSQEWI